MPVVRGYFCLVACSMVLVQVEFHHRRQGSPVIWALCSPVFPPAHPAAESVVSFNMAGHCTAVLEHEHRINLLATYPSQPDYWGFPEALLLKQFVCCPVACVTWCCALSAGASTVGTPFVLQHRRATKRWRKAPPNYSFPCKQLIQSMALRHRWYGIKLLCMECLREQMVFSNEFSIFSVVDFVFVGLSFSVKGTGYGSMEQAESRHSKVFQTLVVAQLGQCACCECVLSQQRLFGNVSFL